MFGPAGAYACGNSDDDTDADASDLAAWAVSFGQAETTPLAAVGSEQARAAIAIVSPMPPTLPALSAEFVDAALALAWLSGEVDSSETEVVYGGNFRRKSAAIAPS